MTPEQKTRLIEITERHHAIDGMLIKGTYGKMNGSFKGCSVGCIMRDINPEFNGEFDENIHEKVALEFGYPEWLVRLQDKIFEGLPDGENLDWHVQLSKAIPVNADWQKILHQVHVAILRVSYRTAGSSKEAVQGVIDLHERVIAGESLCDGDWSAAESAAESAAWSAARSAAESAAWSAARSAAWSAAESAARSAAESAARSAAYQEIRDAVLEVLEKASR